MTTLTNQSRANFSSRCSRAFEEFSNKLDANEVRSGVLAVISAVAISVASMVVIGVPYDGIAVIGDTVTVTNNLNVQGSSTPGSKAYGVASPLGVILGAAPYHLPINDGVYSGTDITGLEKNVLMLPGTELELANLTIDVGYITMNGFVLDPLGIQLSFNLFNQNPRNDEIIHANPLASKNIINLTKLLTGTYIDMIGRPLPRHQLSGQPSPEGSPLILRVGDTSQWINVKHTTGEDDASYVFDGSVDYAPNQTVSTFYGFRNIVMQKPLAIKIDLRVKSSFVKGDTNLDRRVDFADLLTLAQNYGRLTGATWATGDFDLDGSVNFSDLLALAQNYGSGSSLQLSFAKDLTRAQSKPRLKSVQRSLQTAGPKVQKKLSAKKVAIPSKVKA